MISELLTHPFIKQVPYYADEVSFNFLIPSIKLIYIIIAVEAASETRDEKVQEKDKIKQSASDNDETWKVEDRSKVQT